MEFNKPRTNRAWSRLLLIVGCGSWLASCGEELSIVGRFRSDAGDVGQVSEVAGDASGMRSDEAAGSGENLADAGGSSALTGDTVAVESGTHSEFCAGSGPAVRVVPNAAPNGAAPICTPSIARRLFGYGLCSCSDLVVTAQSTVFTLDAFDSRQSSFTVGASGAALGVNGSVRFGSTAPLFSVNGNAIIAGGGSLQGANTCFFGADLKTNAAIERGAASIFSVTRDLWVDSDIEAPLVSSVGRDLYQTPGHSGADTIATLGGSAQVRSFAVPPPCACEGDATLDVAALVAQAMLDNDNAELGLTPDALSDMLASGVVPSGLQCGRFVLSGTSIPGETLRTLSGRMALFVAGDLVLNGDFASEFEPQAELDVFVRGALVVHGTAQIGMPDRPTALRLYVGGSAPITITELVRYAAQIYAPHASVLARGTTLTTITTPLDTYGSIFAARFETQTLYALHYDLAVMELGASCVGAPPPHCDSCRQCPSGLTCIDGACGACRSDADCCEPLACAQGACRQLQLASGS